MTKPCIAFFIVLMALDVTAQNLRLMTYNIRLDLVSDGENAWTKRKDFLVSQILFYEPDIFGVQEALPQQVNFIDEKLSAYSFLGVGREGESKGEFSAIFYNASKFKVKESHTFWLSDTPDRVSKGWDAAYLRVCTFALFENIQSGKQFWVFNTHLDNEGELARTNGLKMIRAKMKAVNGLHLPAFLMGDFNSTPDSQLITLFKSQMDDCRESSLIPPFGPTGTFNGFDFTTPVTRLIDYIFFEKGMGIIVIKYGILSDSRNLRYPSDHFPVVADMKFAE